jgi:hypothetical protein
LRRTSVLSGIKGKFERPVARLVSVSVGGTVPFSEQLFLVPEKLEAIFSSILQERPHELRTIEVARRHLEALKGCEGDIMLVDVIEAAIAEVTPHVA